MFREVPQTEVYRLIIERIVCLGPHLRGAVSGTAFDYFADGDDVGVVELYDFLQFLCVEGYADDGLEGSYFGVALVEESILAALEGQDGFFGFLG